MRNFVITVNGTSDEVAVAEVEAGAAPVAAAPVAAPAAAPKAAPKAAAPKAVVSTWAGRSTGMPRRSAWICIRMSLTLAPPSTRRVGMGQGASAFIARTRSVTCRAMASSTARAMWARVLPRVRPRMVPRAYMSQ